MEEETIHRKLAAILSADVVGYSRLMGDDELATFNLLSQRRAMMMDLIRQHKGRVVDAVGDNLLAEFASVVDAVQSATAIQKAFCDLNSDLPAGRRMEFRIGINVGDVIQEGERLYGDGVNIAARLEQMADPGGICISRTAYDQIESKLPYGYEYLGCKSAKNIKKPLYAYRVILDPQAEGQSGQEREHQRDREDGRGSFDRLKDEAQNLAREISQDEYLKETYQDTKSKVGGFVREMSGEPADRERAFRRLWANRSFQALILMILVLAAINALTSFGRWWFQYPALAMGLAFFLHWLKTDFYSPARVSDLEARLHQTELAKLGGQASTEELSGIEKTVKARIRFYRTMYLFAGVSVFLFLLNLVLNPYSWWFQFPVLGMCLALIFQWRGIPQGKA